MECKISRDDYSGGDALRIMANSVLDLSTARERFARSVRLSLAPHHDICALAELIESSRQEGSRIPLQLSYGNAAASGDLRPGARWSISPSADLFHRLEALLGARSIQVGW